MREHLRRIAVQWPGAASRGVGRVSARGSEQVGAEMGRQATNRTCRVCLKQYHEEENGPTACR
jgi:hypothetical protein